MTDRAPTEREPRTDMVNGEWTWLHDDYDAGTVFITDDPEDSQAPIAEGLSPDAATSIVAAHNMTVRAMLDGSPPATQTGGLPPEPPIRGVWVIGTSTDMTPDLVRAAEETLTDAATAGKQVVVVDGVEFRWRPVEVEVDGLDVDTITEIFEGYIGDRLYFYGAAYGHAPDESYEKIAEDFAAEYSRLRSPSVGEDAQT